MSISIFYATTTGNPRKIAEAIGIKLKVKSHNIMENSVQHTTDTIIIHGISFPFCLQKQSIEL